MVFKFHGFVVRKGSMNKVITDLVLKSTLLQSGSYNQLDN